MNERRRRLISLLPNRLSCVFPWPDMLYLSHKANMRRHAGRPQDIRKPNLHACMHVVHVHTHTPSGCTDATSISRTTSRALARLDLVRVMLRSKSPQQQLSDRGTSLLCRGGWPGTRQGEIGNVMAGGWSYQGEQ